MKTDGTLISTLANDGYVLCTNWYWHSSENNGWGSSLFTNNNEAQASIIIKNEAQAF